jgi:hypothetical protein
LLNSSIGKGEQIMAQWYSGDWYLDFATYHDGLCISNDGTKVTLFTGNPTPTCSGAGTHRLKVVQTGTRYFATFRLPRGTTEDFFFQVELVQAATRQDQKVLGVFQTLSNYPASGIAPTGLTGDEGSASGGRPGT